jgi:predicted nucleic acid-binding protein
MILYLDTSCLVKLYINETGSDVVRDAVIAAEVVATSLIAYPEARSALARRSRESAVVGRANREILSAFEKDWNKMSRIALTESLADDAGELAGQYSLRGSDAIHLASAVMLMEEGQAPVTFLCADYKLNTAAKSEGLKVPADGVWGNRG